MGASTAAAIANAGTIAADATGIFGSAVTVSANSGRIDATGANGRAIDATAQSSSTATVNNSAGGTIQARGINGIAIKASSAAMVTNAALISATQFAIDANTVNVINSATGGIVAGTTGVHATTSVTVNNAGPIRATDAGGVVS